MEFLVSMAVVALLLAIAIPRYLQTAKHSKEVALRVNLAATRHALDRYFNDTGNYPDRLETLVTQKYLQAMPYDPITESERTWILISLRVRGRGGVYDVRSGAEGHASDGTSYQDW